MKSTVTTLVSLLFGTAIFAQSGGNAYSPPQHHYEKVSIRPNPDHGPESVRMALEAFKQSQLPEGSGLMLKSAKESPGGFHYQYVQAYLGFEIHGSNLLATLDRNGRVISLVNNLLWFENAGPAPTLGQSELESWAQSQFLQGQASPWLEAGPVWVVEAANLMAAYRVSHSEGITAYEKLVRASDLQTIQSRDLQVFHHRAMGDTSALGMVFNPDPLTTAGVMYGGNYVDNLDADHPVLSAQRQSVILKDVTWTGSEFALNGPHVSLVDAESPSSPPVTSVDGNFDFTRFQQGFEDVMCYYHIDTFQRYVQSLGFTNIGNTGLPCDPHGLNGQDNSHFISSGPNGRVAFGEGGVDDAEDADVIIHEYGHALSHMALIDGNIGTERNGLDEGLGDYFACSYSRSLSYNLWKNTFTWDGHNEFWDGRSASVSTMYPPIGTDIYVYGEIWASVLMEVYQIIGRMRSDKVVLQSLYSFGPNLSLNDAAHIVIDADSLLYGGVHTDEYQLAFCSRGIFNGSNFGGECYVGINDANLPRLGFDLYPNPTSGLFRVRLQRPVAGAQLRVMDALGHVVLEQAMVGYETEIECAKLPAGVYVAELRAKGFSAGTKRLHILGTH